MADDKAWTGAFDNLATKADKEHLHQIAGWFDLDDPTVWSRHVLDVVGDALPTEGRVFEAGCGVLAFLKVLLEAQPRIRIAGVDGSADAIARAKTEVAPSLNQDPEAFSHGMLPAALTTQPSEEFELTVCNSVLQYVPRSDCDKVISEMLRMTKPGGSVVLGDLCHEQTREALNAKLREHWEGYGDSLPEYTLFREEEFEDFTKQGIKVKVSRSSVKEYTRRNERFNVVLTKPQ